MLVGMLSVALLATGCTTGQPSAFIPPPIPPHPTAARSFTPAPAPTRDVATAPTPAPMALASTGLVMHLRAEWEEHKPIEIRLDKMGGKPLCITVHHEGPSPNPQKPVKMLLAGIEEVHESPRADGGMAAGAIGYHFIIDAKGEVWEGRPIQYQGAHAGNNNANRQNIGICLLGNFEVQKPTPAQKAALQKLLNRLMAQYSIPSSHIYTHREVKEKYGLASTDCPGRYLQPYVDQLRQDYRTAKR